jgi:hypothetical protein
LDAESTAQNAVVVIVDDFARSRARHEITYDGEHLRAREDEMRPKVRLWAIAAVLALVFGFLPPNPGFADDDDDKKKNNNETQQTTTKNKKNSSTKDKEDAPDLEVTGLTLQTNALGQVSEREVMFRVLNIGTEDAPASTARVEISGPVVNVTGSSSAVVRTVSVPALKAGGNPFYGTAELPGPCDGHIVKIWVDLKDDAESGNNSVGPTKVCPEMPKAPQGETVGETINEARRGGGTTLNLPNMGENTVDYGGAPDPKPEHLRPGTHTLTLNPSYFDMRARSSSGTIYSGVRWVGWEQDEDSDPFSVYQGSWLVAQTAVNFDLGELDEVPTKAIQKALLTFDESPSRWTDGDGEPRTVAGCVAVLGIATANPALTPSRELYPNAYYHDIIPSASREWDVTGHVRDQVRFPQDASLRHGYVLRGALEEAELTIEDDSSCTSNISNPRLHITYVVPQN